MSYQLQMDSYNRMVATVAKGVEVGIKVLSMTDTRRIEKNEHAYAVLDLITPLGPIRIRDIRIVWSEPNKRFFLRWRQWRTGKMRNERAEYLDVAGPRDKETRLKYGEAILEVFEQIRAEGAAGTLGRTNPQLGELKAALEQEKPAADTDTVVPTAEPEGDSAPISTEAVLEAVADTAVEEA
jgi:hypothetical protein